MGLWGEDHGRALAKGATGATLAKTDANRTERSVDAVRHKVPGTELTKVNDGINHMGG